MVDIDETLMQELLNTFRVEAADHLQTLNQSLLDLEREPPAEQRKVLVQDAFRAAHSLKGAARAVSMKTVEAVAHAAEGILAKARDASLELNADVCDALYDALDTITALLEGRSIEIKPLMYRMAVFTGETPSEEDIATPAAGPVAEPTHRPMAEETIRVGVGKLDDLMAQVGELLVARISADQRLTELREVRSLVERWQKGWREITMLAHRTGEDAGQRLSEAIDHYSGEFQAAVEAYSTLDRAINRDTLRLGMVTDSLQDHVRRIRMVPFQTIALGLERTVRDAAHSEGKQVAFIVDDNDVEMDKRVLESLKDPLLHLLRNAVAHGIEKPDLRAAAEKTPEGRVSVTVRQRGSEVRIVIRDDGRGFDLDNLRKVAVQRGVISADRAATDEEVLNWAFVAGVSTSSTVTQIAGRGIGLDIVRQQLETVQGRVSVDSVPGKGATIELIVPTSLAMTRGLLVRAAHELYVLPLLSVEKIMALDANFALGTRRMLRVDGKPLPLIALADALDLPAAASNGEKTRQLTVILSVAEQKIALVVDDVLTELELAVKPLAYPLQRVRNIIGAALMGSGQPVIVLNPVDLVRAARENIRSNLPVAPIAAQEEQTTLRILVVDDSITTRTLEKNILEAAGYTVITATDGTQALKRMQDTEVDIVVSDIQMPNMDGITLTRTIRENNDYAHLPIVLVTSLESREDRERGMHAGANAYIVKRGFDQAELLSIIRQLV